MGGAPVPVHVLRRMKAAIPADGEVHTPYGATEALPVASISASEVLAETAAKSASGAGTCVGRHFPGIEWRVIRTTDEPIATINEAEELLHGEIGELIVRGPVVTTEYVTRTEANALHKIRDGATFWQMFRFITYPLLTPIIAVVMTFSVLFTFTDFQLIWAMTRGGPVNTTHLMGTLSYQRSIIGGHLGEGAAISTAMIPFLLGAILVSWFGLQRRKWQHGEAND